MKFYGVHRSLMLVNRAARLALIALFHSSVSSTCAAQDDSIHSPSLPSPYPILFWEPDPKTKAVRGTDVIWSGMPEIETKELHQEATVWSQLLGPPTIRFTERAGKLVAPLHIQTSVAGSIVAQLGAVRKSEIARGAIYFPEKRREWYFPRHGDWVETLDLFGTTMEGGMDEVIERCSKLRVLILPFVGSDYPSRARSLPASLETLVIYNSTLTPSFIGLLHTLPNLKKLVLWGCEVDRGMPTTLRDDPSIRRLGPDRYMAEHLPALPRPVSHLTVLNSSTFIPYWLRNSDFSHLQHFECGPNPDFLQRLLPHRGNADFRSLESLTLWCDEHQGSGHGTALVEVPELLESLKVPKSTRFQALTLELKTKALVIPASR